MNSANKKIKIISLINSLGPAGAERVLLQLAQNIDKKKFEFSVCCLEKDITLKQDFEAAGVGVTSLNIGKKYDPRVFWRLYFFLKKGNFDILHTHLPYAGTLGRIAGRMAGVPKIVSTEHNVKKSFKPLTRFLDGVTLPLADIVTCVAEEVERSFFYEYNEFSEEKLVEGRKHLTVYNGVDLEKIGMSLSSVDGFAKRKELGLGEKDKIIFNAARLIPWKGHFDLIRAFALVAEKREDVRLLIAGWGPLEEEIRRLIKESGLEGKVFLLGRRSDVYEILKITDIFALPYNFKSLFRGGWMSVAILEAMAARKPIVVTGVDGVERAVVDGRTGLVVPMGDAEALSSAFLKLLGDGDLAKRMGENGRALAEEKFSLQSITGQYENIYWFLQKDN